MALTALTEPRTLGQGITRFQLRRQWIAVYTYIHSIVPGIRTIRTTRVLLTLLGLQLCCSCLEDVWSCLCLSSADSHILPHRYCYVPDAALAKSKF
jgi:hypothetical protein